MTRTLTYLFDDDVQAHRAASALERAGIPRSEISILGRYHPNGTLAGDTTAATAGTGLGGVAGAGAGALAALGVIAIPGIGPLVAAGVVATTLAGAVAGGVAGGLLGTLIDYGLSEDEAHTYSEALRRGSTLVSVRVDETRAAEAERILEGHGPVDVRRRRSDYTSTGWSSFDPEAAGYTEEQIRQERRRWGNTLI